MRKLLFILTFVLSSSAFADGENSSDQVVYGPGGFVPGVQYGSQVGGGCVAYYDQATESIVYQGECFSIPANTVHSDYNTLFATQELAQANCNINDGYVQSVIGWGFKLKGFRCAPTVQQNHGGN